jgi:hypothetical protein
MAMTSYLQKKLGDHAIGKASWTMPTTVYLALFSASPGENGSLTSEFTGGSYARVSLTSLMGACDAVSGIAANTSVATFPAPTAAWGSLLYAGIVDASTAGNVLYYMPVANPKVVNNADPAPSFAIGSISVQIGGTTLGMITSYLMKKLVDHSLGKAAFTMPVGVYHLLLGSNPTVAGSLGSEVGVGGYARQALTAVLSAFDATSGASSNSTAITYPTPTADYPSVNYSGVADAASAGNLLFANQLPSPLAIRSGSAPALFDAGAINLTFS